MAVVDVFISRAKLGDRVEVTVGAPESGVYLAELCAARLFAAAAIVHRRTFSHAPITFRTPAGEVTATHDSIRFLLRLPCVASPAPIMLATEAQLRALPANTAAGVYIAPHAQAARAWVRCFDGAGETSLLGTSYCSLALTKFVLFDRASERGGELSLGRDGQSIALSAKAEMQPRDLTVVFDADSTPTLRRLIAKLEALGYSSADWTAQNSDGAAGWNDWCYELSVRLKDENDRRAVESIAE